MSPVDRKTLEALSLTRTLPQAPCAAKASIPDVDQLDSVAAEAASPDPRSAMVRKLSGVPIPGSVPVAFMADQAKTMYRAAEQIKEASSKYKSKVEYPGNELGGRLRRAAQLLAADLGVRILYVSQDGYDTHVTQADGHGQLLDDLSAGLSAFMSDLQEQGIGKKVIVMAFSEFGRALTKTPAAVQTMARRVVCFWLVSRSVAVCMASTQAWKSSATVISSTTPTSAPSTQRCYPAGSAVRQSRCSARNTRGWIS